MISVGRGRDKKILDIENGKPSTGATFIPNWSTNRDDAWGLWDEMKEARFLTRLVSNPINDEVLCIIEAIPTKSSYRDVVFVGKDEADAISGAYIKWKEAEDG